MSLVKLAEVWRGPIVESMHFGVAAIANERGEITDGWGDTSLVTFPRSALKPIQAIPLVESEAGKALGCGGRHVAIACGSHRGEPFHTRLIEDWLSALGVDEEALACGPEAPMDPATALIAARSGSPKRRVYNNCSGKHCGLLTVVRHRGWSSEGYRLLEHPVQQLYLDALSELIQRDARTLPFGIDGCTLPAVAMSVAEFARLMARFACARSAVARRSEAMREIHDAMRENPEYVSGTKQPGVELSKVTKGRLVIKTGAEGFIAVFAPGQGIGVALKVIDGEARARVPALIALLAKARLIDNDEHRELQDLAEPAIRDTGGSIAGKICGCDLSASLDHI